MPDKIIIKWNNTDIESALLPELVTIEYAGKRIEFEDGEIRVETVDRDCCKCDIPLFYSALSGKCLRCGKELPDEPAPRRLNMLNVDGEVMPKPEILIDICLNYNKGINEPPEVWIRQDNENEKEWNDEKYIIPIL